MIDKVLNYQKLDAKALKLEKNLANNENKKQANLMIKFVKDASEKSVKLNKEAGKLTKELDKLKEVQQKGFNIVEKYSNQKLEKLSLDEIKSLEQKVARASGQLKELEQRLLSHANKVTSVLQEFEMTKKKVLLARQKHKENKEAYEEELKKQTPEIQKIRKELEKLEKELDKELFAKYKTLKKDDVFPVIVVLRESNCGGCGVGLPAATLNLIKEKGYIQCENCRRIIYK